MDKLLDSFLKSLLIELALDDLDKLSAFLWNILYLVMNLAIFRIVNFMILQDAEKALHFISLLV
jgi:hypothetical protein